jgi:3-dehydroquinate dehydratase-1
MVRGLELGGPVPLLCASVAASIGADALAEAAELAGECADIVELRADAWDCADDAGRAVSLLAEIRAAVGDTPLILTCRDAAEGGFKETPPLARDALYEAAIKNGLVDFIDCELRRGDRKIGRLRRLTRERGVRLIISYHDFERTPPADFARARLADAIRLGADVAKAAFMPARPEDVLSLLYVSLSVRRDFPDASLAVMSMGELGAHSRVIGGFYGSDLTYAAGRVASAPGQMSAAAMRRALDLMYGKDLGAPPQGLYF